MDLESKQNRMRNLVVRYFDACNNGDVDAIAACFTPEAIHYFPPGMYGGAFRGGRAIGERWVRARQDLGSRWVVERVAVDAETNTAVAEWTHYKTRQGKALRGDEWYEFDASLGLITEIRAYYASPQAADLDRLELAEFDYAGRGYSLEAPEP
jgi:ketosteroid isomerase-like protein